MIQIPELKPSRLKGMEADFGTTVAGSIWRKIINNHVWVDRAYPIGAIMLYHQTITEADGSPKDVPNPEIWKFCNGTAVSDTDSPLNGQTVPNFADFFIKADSSDGAIGGNASINLEHGHSGQTADENDAEDKVADTGGDHPTGSEHHHSISTELSNSEPIIPKYVGLQFYIRIK